MQQENTDWLMAWFAARVPDLDLKPEENFVDKKVIDSFGIVELIEEIETHFGIKFAQADFQSLELFSVAGLAGIIARKKN